MRIIEYNGRPVKRQRKLRDGNILVKFYSPDDAAIVVSPEQWERGAQSVYFDDPTVRRRDVVRQPKLARA